VPKEVIISDLDMLPRLDGHRTVSECTPGQLESHRFLKLIMSANINDDRLTPAVISSLDGGHPKPFSLDDLNVVPQPRLTVLKPSSF